MNPQLPLTVPCKRIYTPIRRLEFISVVCLAVSQLVLRPQAKTSPIFEFLNFAHNTSLTTISIPCQRIYTHIRCPESIPDVHLAIQPLVLHPQAKTGPIFD